MPKTMFDKIWDAHAIRQMSDESYLVHIDRHLIHECTSPVAFAKLELAGRDVHSPELTFGIIDHILSTAPGRDGDTFEGGREFVHAIRENSQNHGIKLVDVDDPRQGIVHVSGPEMGLVLPGQTVVCGDSHTTTSGGLGAWAWGIGSSEVEHVMASQTIVQKRPRTMRVTFNGTLQPGVTAKDMVLYLIGQIGVAAGRGYAVEYTGPAISALSVEERLTICNMSIEFGSRAGFVPPDETTYAYLKGREYVPTGELWDKALAYWRTLPSDEGAVFDRDVSIDCSQIAPQVTWGTTPQDVCGIDTVAPDPRQAAPERGAEMKRSLEYMRVQPGSRLEGLPIDVAFIGSCTNSRLSDIQDAAKVIQGRKVPANVRALVVPGSRVVKNEAEALGLDKLFKDAGFEWREPGCSMCVAINDDVVPPDSRAISTTNRNFENRQGPNARTHLASPATVAASALAGAITDPRHITKGG